MSERTYSNNELLNRSAIALDGGERSMDNNALLNRIADALEEGGGGTGGEVTSVNGKKGKVVLSADDVSAYTKSETDTELAKKQDTLVSGVNIKSINNQSIVGSGNITIQGGGVTVSVLTQAEYDALATKDASTLYLIKNNA